VRAFDENVEMSVISSPRRGRQICAGVLKSNRRSCIDSRRSLSFMADLIANSSMSAAVLFRDTIPQWNTVAHDRVECPD
jgi:hypothetical protein